MFALTYGLARDVGAVLALFLPMCGRFAFYLPPDAIRSLFGTSGPVPNLPPSWNVAPSNNAMVIRRHPETGERLDRLR